VAASFFRRTVYPFLLVGVFLEILNSTEKIRQLNSFLFRLFIVLACIQTIDFIALQYSQTYYQLVLKLLSSQSKLFYQKSYARMSMGVEGFTVHRAQGFAVGMHASTIFCLILYAYLRLNRMPFKFWHRAVAAVACMSSFSKQSIGLYLVLELLLVFMRRPVAIRDFPDRARDFRCNRWISRLINLVPLVVITPLVILTMTYIYQLQPLYSLHPRVDLFTFICSMLEGFEQNRKILGPIDLIGRGGMHLMGPVATEYRVTDIEMLRMFFEGGALNFLFLVVILFGSLLFLETAHRKALWFRPDLYRIFLAAKLSVFLGFMTLVHSLAIFSREVVVIYLLFFTIGFAAVEAARKNRPLTAAVTTEATAENQFCSTIER
jgi:hypothetical protein